MSKIDKEQENKINQEQSASHPKEWNWKLYIIQF